MEMNDKMKAGNGRHDTCGFTEREVSEKKKIKTQDIRSKVGMDKTNGDNGQDKQKAKAKHRLAFACAMSKPSQLNKSIINCKGEGKYLQTHEHIKHIHTQQKKSVSQSLF